MKDSQKPNYTQLIKAASDKIAALESELSVLKAEKAEPIAIIGMSCRFPGGANNPEAYWQLLSDGREAIREIPADRWFADDYYDPNPQTAGKAYTRSAGFLDYPIDRFEPQFFEISPREAKALDPQQRLLLEVCWEALENAGQSPDRLGESRTGVFVGISTDDYRDISQESDRLIRDTYSGIGTSRAIGVGRISYFLGLQGPNVQLDTACSSSLVAAHLACQSLRTGECDLALVGGVNLILSPLGIIGRCQIKALSPDGRCKTFDASADGYGSGEGCGVVLFKRLSDAIENGDNILAVVRGSAINHDGRSSGLTIPNGLAQEAVIRNALKNANLDPLNVSYVEAHGTGTALGDPIEIDALGSIYGQGRPDSHPLTIGSVKTNIGHLEAAAGIASLIKVVLALQHEKIPPHLNFQQPNPYIDWNRFPVRIPKDSQSWSGNLAARFAGISSFGLSGTNAHLILGEAPTPKPVEETIKRPQHLFVLSAKTEAALQELASCYARSLEKATNITIENICYTTTTGRTHFQRRLAIACHEIQELRAKLDDFVSGKEVSGCTLGSIDRTTGDVAFLFAGQGSQYTGMGWQLYQTQPTFKKALDRCAEILHPYLERSLLEVLYPKQAEDSQLDQTAHTQPALFALEYALYQLWISWGIQPHAVMGHSVGEYVAACVAGVFSLEDGLKLIAARGQLMGQLPPGGEMVSLMASVQRVRAAIADDGSVAIAAINGPESTVISGEAAAVREAIARLEAEGINSKPLKVSHGFHSPLMEPMLAEFEQVARQISYSPPQMAMIANVTGKVATQEVATPEYWCRHVLSAVNFVGGMETLDRLGCQIFLECSVQPLLLGMGRQCLPEAAGVWLPSLRPGRSDWQQMLESLGELYARGVKVDWQGFDRDYPQRRKVSLPTYLFQRQRYWLESGPDREYRLPALSTKLHPLIARKFQSPLSKEIFFESLFSTEALPFLADHQVFEHVVVPGACHLSLLLAAASLTFSQEGCQLLNIVFPQALTIPDGKARTVQTILTPERDSLNFRLISFETHPAHNSQTSRVETYALHAVGTVAPWQGTPTQADLQEIQDRCPHAVEGAAIYQETDRRQIQLGDHFRWIETAWVGNGEVLGRLKQPDVVRDTTGYQLYPPAIDAFFQLLVAVAISDSSENKDRNETFVPFQIEKFCYAGRPEGEDLYCYGRLRQAAVTGTNKQIWDLQVFDTSGRAIATIQGFEGKKANREVFLKTLYEDFQDGLYQVEWRKQSRFGYLQAPEFIPSAREISTRLQSRVRELVTDNQPLQRHRQQLLPQLERASLTFIVRAFAQMGWSYPIGETINLSAVAQTLAVVPQHQRLLARLLQILSEEGILASRPGQWTVLQPLPLGSDVPSQIDPALESQAEWQLLQHCGSQLAAVLRGATDPVEVVFPSGDLSSTTRLYQDSPAARAFNQLVQQAVTAASSGLSGERGLRILEIGAGTGGTTSYLLPHLSKEQTRYCFTDIGPAFVQKARERFGDYPFVSYRTLDIEKTPLEQGFETHQQDIVIAANVLHATRDIRQTLENISELLAPGGLLVLLEATARQRWLDLIFGLLEGWWRFADEQLRPDYPLLRAEQWQQLLAESGFTSVAAMPATQVNAEIGQSLIVARVGRSPVQTSPTPRGWLILADRQGVAQQVERHLQQQGDSCLLVEIGEHTQLEGERQWRLKPDDSQGYQQMLELVKTRMPGLQGVIHCWSWETPDPQTMDAKALEEASQLGCATVLSLVQALVRVNESASPRLWIVTRGAQSAGVEGETLSGVSQSSLWGMGKAIALEHPELNCSLIDLDPSATVEEQSESLWAEVRSGDKEDQVAIRQRERYVPRLTSSSQLKISPAKSPLNLPQGTYLITGGLGGLGLLVAGWLVECQVQRLVLVSRQAASDQQQKQLDLWKDRGVEVVVVRADVSDYEAMAEAIASLRASESPLKGIVHAAGVLDDGTLQQQSWQKFTKVMRPKVQGAWNLHRLTQSDPLELFVMFSSAASLVGSPGQANHCAANAFLDALAGYRQSLGLAGQSLNLGAVMEVGEAAERGADVRAKLQGMGAISPPQVLQVLEGLWSRPQVNQVGLMPIDWSSQKLPPRWREWSYLSDWITSGQEVAASSQESELMQQLQAASAPERKQLLTTYLRRQVARVLDLPIAQKLEPNQNLFELGMDSLMAVELRNQLQTQLKIDVPISRFMEGIDISSLEETIEAQWEQSSGLINIESDRQRQLPVETPVELSSDRQENKKYPLSSNQKSLWFIWYLAPDSHAYNVSFRLLDAGDALIWREAFKQLVERHSMLRSCFPSLKGQPYQQILETSALDFQVIDATSWSELELSQKADAFHQEPFDLESGPVLRVRCFRREATELVILVSMHHIICDGWSLHLLLEELDILHGQQQAPENLLLDPPAHTYQDFVRWQQELLASDRGEKLWHYWQKKLGGDLPVLKLPSDRPRPAVQTYRGASHSFTLPSELTAQLKLLAEAKKVSLYTLLLAAYQVFLYRYTLQEDTIVGTPSAGRSRPEFGKIVGYFINVVPMRSILEGEIAFADLLMQTQHTVLEALDHQDFPFALMVERLKPQRDPSYPPIFQTIFVLQQFRQEQLTVFDTPRVRGETRVWSYQLNQYEGQYDLSVEIMEKSSDLTGAFKYNSDLFDRQTIEGMFGNFQTLLEGIVSNPHERIDRLPLLLEAEKHQLLVEWNDTESDRPQHQCIHQLFEVQVERTPHATVAIFEREQLDYRELNARANQLARYLRNVGIQSDTLVALCVERSIDMLVGLLGILKAGGAYVPLDPTYPKGRLEFMLEDARPSVLLTRERLLEALPKHNNIRAICFDRDGLSIARESSENLDSGVTADNLAYVIYTSGSTGMPKGVLLRHDGLCNLALAQKELFQLGVGSRVLQFASLSFDASVSEIFMTLVSGATLVLAPLAALMPGEDLRQTLIARAISHVTLPPSALAMLETEKLSALRHLIVAGEAFPRELADRWSGVCQLWNAYGPSETTVCATATRVAQNSQKISIGCPIANMQLYILDAYLQPVPIGVSGELYIGGAGVARGYLNRPQLTEQKFVPNPFGEGHLYKTGDLGRYLPDGNIEFLGRIDHQVKIRGFRIELGEIESVLNGHPGVRQAVAMVREDRTDNKQLVAYVLPDTGTESGIPESRTWQTEQVASWQTLYDQIHLQTPDNSDPTFNITGWNSSYSGLPIPADEMREWVNQTVARIQSLRFTRVLEIGCGTGLLISQIAPQCQCYWGTDFSGKALQSARQLQARDELKHVKLLNRTADDFSGLEKETFDLVILNSVVQYFPDVDYLLTVLKGALKLVKPGGAIFIGDVRNLALLKVFHSSVELNQAADSLPLVRLRQQIQQRLLTEEELVIHPEFFTALDREFPEIGGVRIQPKRGRHGNELTCFRYDVILQIGGEVASGKVTSWIDWPQQKLSPAEIRQQLLENQPDILAIQQVANARIQSDIQIWESLERSDKHLNVGQLREILSNRATVGIDPEELWKLGDELPYTVELSWESGRVDGSYDVAFKQTSLNEAVQFPHEEDVNNKEWNNYANKPLAGKLYRALVSQLHSFLSQYLPEYMIPNRFVLLESFPLTPNGKVDRQALPAPDTSDRIRKSERLAPDTSTQLRLATIWSEILGVERVGIHENFFELGGHSLLATQLIFRLRDAFEVEIPLRMLFECPTIAELSAAIETTRTQSDPTVDRPVVNINSTVSSCLVPLQPKGDRSPFFCVHPYVGVVFPYVELARLLGENQPFYGLQSLGLNPGETPLTSIEDMASAYIAALRSVQSRGPYRVGGWSMGASIAFEMARQLARDGETVDRLVLIDVPVPPITLARKAIAGIQDIFGQALPQIWPYVGDYLRLYLQPNKSRMVVLSDRPELPTKIPTLGTRLSSLLASSRPLAAVCQANAQAIVRYTPKFYDGRIILLRTARSVGHLSDEPALGWQQFSLQTVQVHLVPGRHLTLLRPPNIQKLAKTLQNLLVI